MTKFPSLPLFADTWRSATLHLSRCERGLYHDLLVLMWITPGCRVPNNREWLTRHLKLDSEEQPMLEAIISEFCQSDGNWLTQKRLKKEWDYVVKQSGLQSDRVKCRWNKEKDSYRGNTTSRNTPNPNPKRKNLKKEKPGPAPPPLPKGASAPEPTPKTNGRDHRHDDPVTMPDAQQRAEIVQRLMRSLKENHQ